jgi:hypothetical protein
MINEKTLLAICNQFSLGTPVANVSPVTGGFSAYYLSSREKKNVRKLKLQ